MSKIKTSDLKELTKDFLLENYQFRVRTLNHTTYYFCYPKKITKIPDFSRVIDNLDDTDSIIYMLIENIVNYVQLRQTIFPKNSLWDLKLRTPVIEITDNGDEFFNFTFEEELFENRNTW
jgi:hypothetical protein